MSKIAGIALFLLHCTNAFSDAAFDRQQILAKQAKCLEFLVDSVGYDYPSNSDHTLFFIQKSGERDSFYLFNREQIYQCPIPTATTAAEFFPSYYSSDRKADSETYRLELLNVKGMHHFIELSRLKNPEFESFSVKVHAGDLIPKGKWKATTCQEVSSEEISELIESDVTRKVRESYQEFVDRSKRLYESAATECNDPVKKAKDKLLWMGGEKLQGALKAKSETPEACLASKNAAITKDLKDNKVEIVDALKMCEADSSLQSLASEMRKKFEAHTVTTP